MDKPLRAFVLLAFLALCACDRPPLAATSNDQPAALPADILRGLNTDEAVLTCFAAEAGTPVIVQATWFSTRRADLDGDGQSDWLVSAQDPCLRRDNALTWVYLVRGQVHRLAARIPAQLTIEASAGTHAAELIAGAQGGERRYHLLDEDYVLKSDLPQAFAGQWRALSKVYFELDPLHLRPRSVDMGSCKDLSFDTLEANTARVRLALASSCRMGADKLVVVDLATRENTCQIEATFYTSREAAQNEAPFVWGVFERPVCP